MAWAANTPVQVVVDMDPTAPGIQTNVSISATQAMVDGIAVTIFDPLGTRTLWGIGYIGAIDRGIAFGHIPSNLNAGVVSSVTGESVAPANPDNHGVLEPGFDPAFPGPEVQYLEAGALAPALLSAQPVYPTFVVRVALTGARPGDVFEFEILDFVRVWSRGRWGAFSTASSLSLDTGGDAVLDGTPSLYGADPDTALPAPPAAYLVDFAPGPFTITLTPPLGVDVGAATTASCAVELAPAAPNPFTIGTLIEYRLRAPSLVCLAVFDASGRRVRTLVDANAPEPAGSHRVTWNGQSDAGRDVGPGVYYLRLDAGSEVRMHRLARLRR